MPAARRLNGVGVREERLDDVRADDQVEGEEAEHDARDAGQDLEDRLDDRCGPGGWRTRTGRSRLARPIGAATSIAMTVTMSVPDAAAVGMLEHAASREPARREQLLEVDLRRGTRSPRRSATATMPALIRTEHDRRARSARPGSRRSLRRRRGGARAVSRVRARGDCAHACLSCVSCRRSLAGPRMERTGRTSELVRPGLRGGRS